MLVGALDLQAAGRLELVEQDDGARDLRREDRGRPSAGSTPRARPSSWTATVRALTPHVGAYLEIGGEDARLGVRRARPAEPPGLAAGELRAE